MVFVESCLSHFSERKEKNLREKTKNFKHADNLMGKNMDVSGTVNPICAIERVKIRIHVR